MLPWSTNKVSMIMTHFQGRNKRIHDCHVFPEYDTIINVCKDDAVIPKEDAFIDLTLNEVTSD
jgi:hypothetical protein